MPNRNERARAEGEMNRTGTPDGIWAGVRIGGAAVVCAIALAGGVARADSVLTTDGGDRAGTVVTLDSTNVVARTSKGIEAVPLRDVTTIRLGVAGADAMARKGQHVLRAADGSVLAVREATVSNGVLRALSASAGAVSLPLEAVSVLFRPGEADTAQGLERERERLRLVPGRADVLVMRGETGKYAPVQAILDRLEADKVVFTYDRVESSMGTDTLVMVMPASPDRPPAPAASLGQLVCTDGSRVVFGSVAMDADRIAVANALLGRLAFPRAAVAEIRFRGEQLVCLSDLQPAEVVETPFLDDSFPWRKNRSLSGGPLRLGGVTYEKGLSLHARCRMTFALEGKFRRFLCKAGIDDEVRAGAAVLTISADGRTLVNRVALARNRPAESLALDLAGARELVILVDFAEGTLGSGGRVNLCDPLLSR